ncbi:fibronectin type III domain-containing protein [Alistipes senegalensis]|uniref:fibronectin type III domain-containing protein n=1 Tax=Alistipes senegalensis TaxID=1288121 RepID=UPI0018AA18E0|nr:fibronectin type III domain-containing protein [Alistipes senegalensis]
MKTTINKILLFVMLFAGATSLHGCSDPDGIIEDIAYDREFSPLNFTYTLTNNVNVAFSWTVMTGVSDYTLTLSYTDGDGGVYDQVDLIAPLGGDGATATTMDYTFKELPGNRAWKAELVAVSQRAGVADSKPAVCTFATGVENLFLNDGKVSDDDITATTALLRWVAGSNVTALNVTPGVGTVSLSAEQIAAGECELTGLTTGTAYTVELLRDDAVRGIVTFVASDKIDVDVIDKSASTITLSWGADRQVTGLVLKGGDDERNITLTQGQIAAHTYAFEGLKERTEYSISVYIDGVESGNLVVTTLGQSNFWDFTDASKWPIANWDSNQTIDGLTILAASGKNVQIQADADYGCNYLDLRGKSTVKEGEAPTQRAVQFSVVGEGVIAIDCYANGTGRNFYAYVDALGKAFGPFEAPTAANRGKVYIPCPGIPASAVVSIWTDATINHIYSIGWYEGTEAPGQNATPLAAPAVTASPAEVTKGDNTPVTFSWAAVPNAATYTYRLALTKLVGETEEVVRLSETVSATEMTVPAETVAELKPGTYTISVTAAAASDFLYKPSPAGSAVLTVNDTKLATPVVKLDPAKVTVGEQKEVVASWDAVEGAASYAVTFNNGTSETVNTTSHTIAAAEVAALAVGEYTISVVATPADASAQASDPGTAKLTVAEASTPGGDNFAWDFSSSAFSDLITRLSAAGSAGLSDVDETIEGLRILSGGASLRGGAGYIQSGGAGSTTKRVFSFTASASGKLKVVASNTGSSAVTGRSVTVQVGDDEAGAQSKEAGSGSGTPTTCEFDLAVSAETIIYIYPTNGLRFYSIEYVSDGPGGSGTDYTMTLSAKAGVLSSNITGLPTSWVANDSTWTATDDTGASTITFTGNIYYSTDAAKNVVWYFNKGKTETHVSASDLGKIRKITIMPNSTREPDYLKCTYNGGTVLAATEPLGVKTATITFDFADVSADDFRIDYVLDWTSSVSNVEIGKVVIEYTK